MVRQAMPRRLRAMKAREPAGLPRRLRVKGRALEVKRIHSSQGYLATAEFEGSGSGGREPFPCHERGEKRPPQCPFIAENRGPKLTYNLDTPTPYFPRKALARCR